MIVDIKYTNANEWNILSSNLLQIENESYDLLQDKEKSRNYH